MKDENSQEDEPEDNTDTLGSKKRPRDERHIVENDVTGQV